MQSSFTQGPWIADGAQIFTSDTNVAQANGYRIDRETVAANARLIAAAPELLEALARLEFAAQCRDNTMGDPSRLIQVKAELASAARQARAAIAKATGETE